MDLTTCLKSTALVCFVIAVLVVAPTQTRHHGRRHKRQHGANLYLPSTFIVPGGEGDQRLWGDWGSPSECSRSCGGGVSYQTRECRSADGQCSGGNRKYFSCNTQDCPESEPDFRHQQCAHFNSVPIENVHYSWVPYTKAPNPCELNCMPKGERFYYRHKAKVIDGTRCNAESPDVCVDGKCQHVGCDLMLGSDAKEDKCKKCAGDGSSCRTVSGRLDMNNLQVGYNDILLVPSGATNVNIREVSPSINYLAIRNLSGNYYLNGNWRIDVPRELSFAGASWHYNRQPQGFAAPDHITCQGPTSEPVYLVLLYQDRNVGIEYEYSVPEITAHQTEKTIYTWTFKAFSECSQECGGGTQTREVQCRSQTTLEEANPSLCDAALKPVTQQACGQEVCPPRWSVGDYSKCSEPCGENGNQTRTVQCEQVVAANVSQVVEDKLCLESVGNKPATVSECNVGIACAQWHVGPWQACSQLCGEGVQKRQIQCYRKEGTKVTRLSDDDCVEEKPAVEHKCVLRPCEGVDWIVSSWSSCKPCGLTQEARTLACAAKNGKIYDDSFCKNHKLPETRRTCESSTICQYQWFKSQWSKCSSECGDGIQTRHVMCGTFDGKAVQKADNETECGDAEKPLDTRDCKGEKSDCLGQWFSGPWTTCTKKCGGGERTRKVLCLVEGLAVKDSQCSEDTIEFSTEECNKEACSEDETLPVDVTSKPIVEEDDVGEEWCEEGEESYDEELEMFGTDDLGAFSVGDGFELDNTIATDEDSELMFSDGTEPTLAASDSLSTNEASGDFSTDLHSSVSEGSGSGDEEITTPISSASSIGISSTEVSIEQSTTSSPDSTPEFSGQTADVSTVSSDLSSETTESITQSTNDFTTLTDLASESSSGVTESVSSSTSDSLSNTADQLTSEQSSVAQSESTTTDEISTTPESSSTSDSTESTTSVSETSPDETSGTTDSSTTELLGSESTTPLNEDSTTLSSTDSETATTISNEYSTTGSSQTSDDSTTDAYTTTSDETATSESLSTVDVSTSSTEFSATSDTTNISTVSSVTETTDSATEGTSELSSDLSTESTVDLSTVSSASDQTTVEPWSTTDMDSTDESTDSSVVNAANTTPNTLSTIIKLEQKPRKCRKRPTTIACIFTEFGCCAIDSKTAATGPFDEGCPTPKTCSETPHGCCPDGLTPATNKKLTGCPEAVCAGSLFGCCSDGVTEATNSEKEGCPVPVTTTTEGGCKASKFGCCEDGVSEATGPNGAGCTVEVTTLYPDSTDEPDAESTEISDLSTDAPPKDCTLSEFGCCPDGISEATGTQFHGCHIPAVSDCAKSVFGCCQDNRTSATGADFKGCASCLLEMFGCCDDGQTPAHGVNREGCCLNTPFGCCPNNINAAEGPNLEGCGCENSPYGCCPDNKTSARGYDNEGCGCEYSQFGCCLDHLTKANGPNNEGCPCETFQFGCCPDGITTPKGPHNYGCHCSQTEFKCCSDEKTPAKGPEFEGCTCEHSKYGCCADGHSEAAGDNFEGCTDVPGSPQKACGLETDRGNCTNYVIKYFFNTAFGACSRFWYGGCEGNGNRFDDAASCKETCEEPVGKAVCALPKVHGPCTGYYPTYYYNSDTNSCSQFVYGGCMGNNNRFETLEACQGMCVVDRSSPTCEQSVEAGPCGGSFENWYFDKEADECRQFIYGGCKGNANRFPTEHACKYQCQKPGVHKPSCSLPKETGQCGSQLARWHYSESTRTCLPFYYSGCDGNKNSFESLEHCESQCPRIIEKDLCELPADIGLGDNYQTHWYFDTKDSKCRQFYYGGSGGNANKFNDEQSCLSRCEHHNQPTPPPAVQVQQPDQSVAPKPGSQEHCRLQQDAGDCRDPETRFFYNHDTGACERFTYGGCNGNANNFKTASECEQSCWNAQNTCTLPAVIGECQDNITRWYFESRSGRCEQFSYGGCYGNPNNFESESDCQQQCQPEETGRLENRFGEDDQSVCTEPMELGNCNDNVLTYFFNTESRKCEAFRYTGCGGNGNRFESMEQCDRQCGSFKGTDVCHQPKDVGPCSSYQTKYFYNGTSRTCEAFTYGGCEGTGNRFSSFGECQSVCIVREEPVQTDDKAICKLPAESGRCQDTSDTYKRWYYDDDRGTCVSFIYVGCAGNQNNFHSYEGCVNYCVEKPVTQAPEDHVDSCQAQVDKCNALHCPYGVTRSYDAQNCEQCECEDPCQHYDCPDDSSCSVDPQRDASGQSVFVPVCRQKNKPGACPRLSNYTSSRCDRECYTDADCRDDNKCCEVDCSVLCLQPAAVEAATSAPDDRPHYPGAKAPALEEKTQEELDVTQPEGQVATLRCFATGYPLPTVTWRRGAIILNTNQGRYVLSSSGDLQIVQVHQSDSGTYICVADNGYGAPVERKVELRIADPVPTNAYIMGSNNSTKVVELNHPVTLRCLAGGFPKPTVTWWRGEEMLPIMSEQYELSNDYSMTLRRVRLQDLGEYSCQAYSYTGKPSVAHTTVKAYGPVHTTNPEDRPFLRYLVDRPQVPAAPRPDPRYPYRPVRPTPRYIPVPEVRQEIIPPSTNIVLPNGNAFSFGATVTLQCDVKGYPKPEVVWSKDDVRLNSTEHVQIYDSNRLVINGATALDSGYYRCSATNIYGFSQHAEQINIDGVYIPDDCFDNPFYANCKLIIKGKFCSNKYYYSFCCRSCRLSGFLP